MTLDNNFHIQDDRQIPEFDLIADDYYVNHAANISVTGENPEYFAEYKILDLFLYVEKHQIAHKYIFDFGSGIGNSIPFFRKYFSSSVLNCGDISSRSLEIAQSRFPGAESYINIGETIKLEDSSQDIVFTACVFHHIPKMRRAYWLSELFRVLRPGGMLAIYEHNPLNPLTLRAVNTCPFDINAELIKGNYFKFMLKESGWLNTKLAYKIFFPAAFKILRPLEKKLEFLPLGAQYRLMAQKPK